MRKFLATRTSVSDGIVRVETTSTILALMGSEWWKQKQGDGRGHVGINFYNKKKDDQAENGEFVEGWLLNQTQLCWRPIQHSKTPPTVDSVSISSCLCEGQSTKVCTSHFDAGGFECKLNIVCRTSTVLRLSSCQAFTTDLSQPYGA